MTAIELVLAAHAAASGGPEAGASALGPLLRWLELEDPWSKWLAVFGFLGQAIFFGRWVIQWVVSERRGESHVPEMFWWFSLAGAAMLFTYFLLRHDAVGMLGQGVGWTVYSRNLYLIRFKHRLPPEEPAPGPGEG